jgi:hypothetical protein
VFIGVWSLRGLETLKKEADKRELDGDEKGIIETDTRSNDTSPGIIPICVFSKW